MSPGPRPYRSHFGIPAGLLLGSVCVLLGIVVGQSPEVILLRSVVSGVICGILVSVLELIIRSQGTRTQEDIEWP